MIKNKNLLKKFYEQYGIKEIYLPKHFHLYEFINDKCYPKITADIFIAVLNVLWKEQIEMNLDNDCDLEQLIEYRKQTYQERVIEWLVESAPIYLDCDKFNSIEYEIKKLFKGE